MKSCINCSMLKFGSLKLIVPPKVGNFPAFSNKFWIFENTFPVFILKRWVWFVVATFRHTARRMSFISRRMIIFSTGHVSNLQAYLIHSVLFCWELVKIPRGSGFQRSLDKFDKESVELLATGRDFPKVVQVLSTVCLATNATDNTMSGRGQGGRGRGRGRGGSQINFRWFDPEQKTLLSAPGWHRNRERVEPWSILEGKDLMKIELRQRIQEWR